MEMLPASVGNNLVKVTRSALTLASDAAIFTLRDTPGSASSNNLHRLGVAVTGGVGGFFGLGGLALELPVSTTVMLRSIADIARSEGLSLADAQTQVDCLEVFALGGTNQDDDAVDSAYFAARYALGKSVSEAVQYLAQTSVVSRTAPAVVRLLSTIAQRFGVQVTQKVAAQLVPAFGAVGGAVVNSIFIDHYQDMARGHFIVRRLENQYGEDIVRSTYLAL
jgi:hypothetical protein